MKRLSIFISGTDAQNNPIKIPVNAPFSVLMPERKMEIVETTHVAITGFGVNFITCMLRVEFRLGGYDSAGTFHPNPDYGDTGLLAVNRIRNIAWWDAQIAWKQTWSLENMLAWLIAQNAVALAGTRSWGFAKLQGEIETV